MNIEITELVFILNRSSSVDGLENFGGKYFYNDIKRLVKVS